MTPSLAPSQEANGTVLHADADIVVGAYWHVHICVYRGALTLPLLEQANAFHKRLISRYGRTAIYGMAENGLALPPTNVRERGAELIKENADHVDAAVVVLPGEGFWASAVRSVVTASFLVARQPYPSRCQASLEEGAAWLLASSSRPGTDANGLARAVRTMARA